MSRSTTPAHAAGSQKVLTINWRLLWRRLRSRGGLLLTSARHRAANTEYIPPTWVTRLRLTWFRIGLIALAAFVFTQKQIDFTLSVGAEGLGVAADADRAPVTRTSTLSMLPGSSTAAAPAWDVNSFDAATVRAYINRFDRVARTEEEKYNIPAPAKMAMAILESEAGGHHAAVKDNNHFPLANTAKYYDNAWSSWRAHSESLNRRYPELAHESVNYQQWIAALDRSGYSRDARYGQKLLRIIERFDLGAL
ncbi:glucosaminidase domain-containing protein [Lewinella sp. JB7]|uniref:glucosaminidase domain-containing protein n=1 Tax=Lewinella sp. JB7 TaxID=2962887 RepID=UPI0020CA002C|nr:glucosaminidase domain-containing protein [Lewinella sp. JB7]MCP9237306.1 glucosaminidase domain-containing protein [Lewinella sp. JB7]